MSSADEIRAKIENSRNIIAAEVERVDRLESELEELGTFGPIPDDDVYLVTWKNSNAAVRVDTYWEATGVGGLFTWDELSTFIDLAPEVILHRKLDYTTDALEHRKHR